MSNIGGIGQGPNIPVTSGHHKEVVIGQAPNQQQQPSLPNAANPNMQQALQNFQGGLGSMPGYTGAPSTGLGSLGVVSNPGAMLQAAAGRAQAGAQLQQMSGAALQAMNALGLGHLPQAQQFAMMNGIGQQMVAHANQMGAQALAQSVLPNIPGMNVAAGAMVTGSFNQGMMESMGGQFLSTLGQQQPVHWGRTALGDLGPQYFNNFDPRSLAAMPDRALVPFSNQLMGSIMNQSPLQLGQQMMPLITPDMQQVVGQNMFNMMAPGMMQNLGQQMLPMLQAAPGLAGQALLGGLGQQALQNLGQNVFGQLPGLEQMPGGDLANQLLGGLGQGGNLGDGLLGGITNFFKDKLLGGNTLGGIADAAKGLLGGLGGKLTDVGKNLLGSLGGGVLGKAGGAIMDLIGKGKGALSSLGELGKGLLSKVGGGVLDKLGGVGKIASGALSLLNGQFDVKQALKIGLNFIPVVGPALGLLSNIPGVGAIFDKVLGGVGKVLEKIPGVSQLFKGIGKVGGLIGKGVGKVVDGIKNVGKSIVGGAKKLFSKI